MWQLTRSFCIPFGLGFTGWVGDEFGEGILSICDFKPHVRVAPFRRWLAPARQIFPSQMESGIYVTNLRMDKKLRPHLVGVLAVRADNEWISPSR
jgi:hypothetical protein